MGVNHGGFDIFVAQQFLDGADVVAILQEVGGEAVTKGVATDPLRDPGFLDGLFDRFLDAALVQMISAHQRTTGILGDPV